MNRSTRYAVAADHIFDGRTKHKDAAVVIGDSYIASLIPQSELPTDLSVRKLPQDFGWRRVSLTFKLMAAEMSCSTIRLRPVPLQQ